MKILAIVLTYNEADSINTVINGIKQELPTSDILIIDGESTDNTLEIANNLNIPCLVIPSYFGIGGAEEVGIKYAYQNNYNIILRIDGDDQHIYSEIEKLLNPLYEDRCDFILGSRYLLNTGYKASLTRKIGNIVFSKLIFLIAGLKITDPTSSFHAFNRDVIEYFETKIDFDYSEVDSLVILKKAGFRIKEVSTKMKQREHGNSSFSFINAFKYVFTGVVSILVLSIRKISPKN